MVRKIYARFSILLMPMKTICTSLLGIFLAVSVQAMSTPIDLNDFFADPTVTVSVDGTSATFTEDALFSAVLLSNDPGLGDPNVILPGPGVRLVFDFLFDEPGTPSVNDDEFSGFLIDASTGTSVGPAFEFFIRDSATGTVQIDLSSLTGMTLGLQFQLSMLFGDVDLDSTLTVSNLHLVQPEAIPEPTDIALLTVGALFTGFQICRRRGRLRCPTRIAGEPA